MTDPQTQAQADAEQIRLVREALALRRERPAEARAAGAPAMRFLPGGPRPTGAEVGARWALSAAEPATLVGSGGRPDAGGHPALMRR